MQNIVKRGTVESVSGNREKVRMKGTNTALVELTTLKNGGAYTGYGGYPSHSHNVERWTPSVGDEVVCLMIQEGAGQGYILGAI